MRSHGDCPHVNGFLATRRAWSIISLSLREAASLPSVARVFRIDAARPVAVALDRLWHRGATELTTLISSGIRAACGRRAPCRRPVRRICPCSLSRGGRVDTVRGMGDKSRPMHVIVLCRSR